MNKTEHQIKAEAAIERAKAMLTENKSVAVEISRTMTDGRNTYTRNVGGVFSARTEAEFMLYNTFNALPVGDGEETYCDAAKFMQAEATKLGITLE